MIGLVVVVTGSLVVVSVMSLSVNRAVMSLFVAHRVDVVRVHSVVIVSMFVRCGLALDVVSSSNAVLIVASTVAVVVRMGILGRESMVDGVLMVVHRLNIALVIVLMIKRAVSRVIG